MVYNQGDNDNGSSWSAGSEHLALDQILMVRESKKPQLLTEKYSFVNEKEGKKELGTMGIENGDSDSEISVINEIHQPIPVEMRYPNPKVIITEESLSIGIDSTTKKVKFSNIDNELKSYSERGNKSNIEKITSYHKLDYVPSDLARSFS